MKAILAGYLLLSSIAVWAQETRNIYDLMYLPTAGTTYGFSEANAIAQRVKVGSRTAENDGIALIQTLGHSFTDRFSVQGSLNYLNLVRELGSTKTEQSGISDPRLTLKFRAVDDAYRFDILAGAVISLGDKEYDSSDDTNNRRGGSDIFAGLQWGTKSGTTQYSLLALYTKFLPARIKDDFFGDSYTTSSFENYSLTGEALFELAKDSFLKPYAGAVFFNKPDAFGINMGLEYQHLLSKDLLARFGGQLTSFESDDAFDEALEYKLLAALNYQF